MPLLKPDPVTGAPTFIPEPTQEEFLFSRAKHTHIGGGVRAGKTLILCYKIALLSRIFVGNEGLVGRLTFPDLRDTTIKTFIEVLNALGWEYKWKEATHECLFPNGSLVMFRHLLDFQGRMGMNLGFAAFDQLEEIPENTFNLLTTRLSRELYPTDEPEFADLVANYGEAWQRISMSTSNPAGHNWIYKRWKVNHENRKVGAKFSDKYELFEVITDEQERNLPADYISTVFEGAPDDMIARYRFGSWDDFNDSIYTGLWITEIHTVEPWTPLAEDGTYYRAYDHGGIAHAACCLFAYFSPSPYDGVLECVIFDEYFAESGTPDTHAYAILSRHETIDFYLNFADAQIKQRNQFTASGTERSEVMNLLEIYAEHGLDLVPATRELNLGINSVQRLMKIDPSRPHRFLKAADGTPLKGAPRLYVHRNCIHLIEQIMTYHRSQLVPGRVVDYKNDAVDAMRFLIASPYEYDGSFHDVEDPSAQKKDPVLAADIDNTFKQKAYGPGGDGSLYSIFD